MTMVHSVVERTRALLGTRFRPQGRDARFGLDCVGLVLTAYRLPPASVRRDYALRGTARAEIEAAIHPWFRRVPSSWSREGDLMLVQAAADVLHLGIRSSDGMVHADARFGVVERPGVLPWPVLAIYRLRPRHLNRG